ncbi:DNA starvation/stationary phase protection protein [Bacteriovorax sp. DB6_IX]|uniref:Dps family protein n=1 Tax=Bacteriovorax sp. DB6_IX TaxID=1353530 RepID=UPI00038A41AF|nr:DNA starvation/stationary phase protection protein [Bacteriovorax sp. DB6_IX]EQC52507.1 putative DNA protection during starvation protein 1 [Bacteriovorax sp. DB6_IX]
MSTNQLLRLLQADAQVFYFKLHNLHWNVTGMMFAPLHEKTELLYNDFAVTFDDLAERQLQLHSTPVVTLKDSLEISRIQETNETKFTAQQVVNTLIDDLNHFHKEFRKLSEVSEGDSTTQAYADDKVAWLEKELWMLRAMNS